MGIFDFLRPKNIKLEDYDWAIGKKGISMIAGVGVVPKEAIEASMKDPVIEGKKRGYQQAAEEFEKVYNELKIEYDNAKKLFERQIKQKDKELDTYISVLTILESEKEKWEQELKEQETRLDVTVNTSGGFIYFDFKSFIKNHPKFDQAKIEGYNEAKALYKRKLSYLKGKLKKLQKEADAAIVEHQALIAMTLSEITKIRMAIAEMKLIK